MTDTPDLPGEMIRMLDDDTVEAILAGDATGSVPAEYARVAQLARAARVDAACDDPAGSEQREAEVVAAIATAMRQGISWNSTDDVVKLRRHRLVRAAGIAAFAAVTLTATAAAAATNHLPSAVQDALSTAASHVGVHLPEADAHSDQPASTPPATEEVPQHDHLALLVGQPGGQFGDRGLAQEASGRVVPSDDRRLDLIVDLAHPTSL